jgi:hypothetical protein
MFFKLIFLIFQPLIEDLVLPISLAKYRSQKHLFYKKCIRPEVIELEINL